jgi:GNAT superfamily N-acetyltransferase
VSREPFVSRHLEVDDDLEAFSSGQPSLDEWLRRSAHHAEAMRSARTWVWTQGGSVVGYFSLAGHVIERDALPRQVGRGSPDRIPSVLIARLALHQQLQGRGLGGVLLADACARVVSATEVVAARLVVVDAINEHASSFLCALRLPTDTRNRATCPQDQRPRQRPGARVSLVPNASSR